MRIGYARTSTTDQIAGLEAQIRDLKQARVDRLYSEQLSSVDSKRVELEAAIDYCRDGDVLVCTKLDRLARSVADLVKIEERLKVKGAAIFIMDPAMDTATPNGRLIFNVIASIAQFEREIMLTRQREGIAKAKGEGKFKGRKKTAASRASEVHELARAGMKPDAIAARLSEKTDRKGKPMPVSLRSVYRIMAAEKARAASGVNA